MSDDVTSRLRLVTPPASEPVSLSEAKLFLRVEQDDEDAVINRAIGTAREACEQFLSCALLPQSLSYTIGQAGRYRLVLPVGPVTAVSSVVVTDSDGSTATLDSGCYQLGVDGYALYFDPVPCGAQLAVTFSAALADTADALPSMIKQGMLHHVAALYAQRDGVAAMPLASVQYYHPFRRVRL